MSSEILVLIGSLGGIVVGSIGTIIMTLITKYYEDQSSYRKMIIKTSMEYYKETIIAARNSVESTKRTAWIWPYESFVISISHLVNRVVNKRFKIDEIDEIVAENKKLIKALKKIYS